VVREFIARRCGIRLGRSACTRYLHRLGFVYKRPKKRLLKADEAKRAAFVAEYAALLVEVQATGAKIFFVDETHFRADGDLGLGARGGDGEHLPGHQGQGAGEDGPLLRRANDRTTEVQSRCQRKLQSLAEAVTAAPPESHQDAPHVDLIGASD